MIGARTGRSTLIRCAEPCLSHRYTHTAEAGGDGRPVRNVPVDADDLLRSLQRTAQETSVKVVYAPSATTGAVAFDEMRTIQGREEARHQGRESFFTRPGLPGSSEEVSRMLGRPVPPAYADVAGSPFQERDVRTKTGASRGKAGGRGKANQSVSTASDTPTDPAPQREPRAPRLEETETGEELVPIRTVETTTDARSMVRS